MRVTATITVLAKLAVAGIGLTATADMAFAKPPAHSRVARHGAPRHVARFHARRPFAYPAAYEYAPAYYWRSQQPAPVYFVPPFADPSPGAIILRRTIKAQTEPGLTSELAPDSAQTASGGPVGGIPGFSGGR